LLASWLATLAVTQAGPAPSPHPVGLRLVEYEDASRVDGRSDFLGPSWTCCRM
jgi:hypothetical protein